MHVQTLFTHDAHARLLLVNEPGGGAPAPRFFLGRTQTGNLWRFRADLPESLMEALEALCLDEPVGMAFHRPPRHVEAYVQLLATHAPVHTLWMGPAYHFTAYPEPSRPLLALMAYKSLKYSVHINWTLPAYLATIPIIAHQCMMSSRRRRISQRGVDWMPWMRRAAIACVGPVCWHSHEAYEYPPTAGVVVHGDDWRWGPKEHYSWREHEGRGYWKGDSWTAW